MDPLCKNVEYVLGFYFLNNRENVVLIRKNKPAWQAGKLNGVGGRIESTDESPAVAMTRKFHEETGKHVAIWNLFSVLEFPGATVDCFFAHGDRSGLRLGPDSPTEEKVNAYFVEWILLRIPFVAWPVIVPNLRWLIPLALSGETVVPTIRFD